MGLSRTPSATPLAPRAANAAGATTPLPAAARRQALRALATTEGGAARLVEQLQQEHDRSVREAGFTALLQAPGPATVQALLPLLRSDDAGLRNGALDVLAHLPEPTAAAIDGLLADADPDVRILTVNLLQELQHPGVLGWLLGVLAQEPQVNVVAAAVEVLTELADPRATAPLRAARERFADEPFLAFAIDLALQRTAAR